MLLMKVAVPASRTLGGLMPNSRACLMQLTKSPPAFSSPITSAPLAWPCTRNDEKSVVPGNG